MSTDVSTLIFTQSHLQISLQMLFCLNSIKNGVVKSKNRHNVQISTLELNLQLSL